MSKTIRISYLFAGLLLVFPTLSFAQDNQVISDKTELHAKKLNIAGRQRMLTQRIAKSACFIASYHDVEKHKEILRTSVDLFDKSFYALRDGDNELGFPKEENENILQQEQLLKPIWDKLKFASEVLLSSYQFPGLDAELINTINMPTLQQANEIVKTMDLLYSKSDSATAGVKVVNIAGRQRMLTQKAAKEFCLINYGIYADENRKNLEKTVQLFDQSLEDLHLGNSEVGIPAAPTFEISQKLLGIKKDWQQSRQIYLDAINGAKAKKSAFDTISNDSNTLLKDSNDAVNLFVSYYK